MKLSPATIILLRAVRRRAARRGDTHMVWEVNELLIYDKRRNEGAARAVG